MSYRALHGHFRRIGDLQHAQSMLSWDEAVMMPRGGGSGRADSLATLAGVVHTMISDPCVGEWSDAASQETELDEWERANVRQIQRLWRRARAVPEALVVEFSRETARCEQAWRVRRADNDWNAMVEPLRRVVELIRRRGEALGDALGMDPYDALMDEFEPGMSRSSIAPVFEKLKRALPALIDTALGTQRDALPMPGPFTDAQQAALGRNLMERIGFDFERGRLDTSHHPFCGGDPDDTRITTRYNRQAFLESMFAVLHETGHAMYEQGLPVDWRRQPVGSSGGMALHESQSLLMEMQVCRSLEFLQYAAPIVRESLGADDNDPAWSAENLHRAATRVERGFIRVDADEVTYPMHVILRYELEQDLVGGSMRVTDIPDAWDAKMTEYLDLRTAGNERDGCMQDVHWFTGLIGYFPTYTLGALTAAQLFAAACAAGAADGIGQGEFEPLLIWLRRNVHTQASAKSTMEILKEATGAPLRTDAFLAHVARRYGVVDRLQT
ncbi:MAG: carboxypeptidase M32 [Gammaproteobacteria bacterium]|nr:carboxypeptidase M32 [Gammaproteobacteria bacterium]MDE0226200.1 carboxypeptidase M32 [Gammaproteobacteria bacterium]